MKVFTHGLLLGMVFVLVAQNIESPAVKLPTDTLPVDYDRVTWAFWKHVFFVCRSAGDIIDGGCVVSGVLQRRGQERHDVSLS